MIKRFTENLISLFEESGLNQKELSKNIGINQSQISRYLKGILPDVKTIVKICDFFGCSIDFITGLSDNFNYKASTKGFDNLSFYPYYAELLKQNKLTHYQLAKKGVVCETSLRLWKRGTLPNFDVLINIAFELGGSIDKLLGRIK